MQRVAVLGPGASGKSTFAARLGDATGLPVTELDTVFWGPDLVPRGAEEWVAMQHELVGRPRWILDGDLGPYDVPATRLAAADTVIILDFPTWRCVWRALRRGRHRRDFWRWVLRWRRDSRPALLRSIATHAPSAALYRPRRPRDLERLEATLATQPP